MSYTKKLKFIGDPSNEDKKNITGHDDQDPDDMPTQEEVDAA